MHGTDKTLITPASATGDITNIDNLFADRIYTQDDANS